MNCRFSEIVDIHALQELMYNLWKASGLGVGILERDGTVLVAAGWQTICSSFHRCHPETLQCCQESDRFIADYLEQHGGLGEDEYVEYLCKNGLVDVAVPILIGGKHLATLFIGQFLYEPPDEDFFRAQARRYAFDEATYLDALHQVPIFPRDKVREILAFYSSFVQFLTRLGTETLQRLEAQDALAAREQRLLRQNEELSHLSSLRGIAFGQAEEAIPQILEAAARTLEVARASVWFFNEQQTAIRCLVLVKDGRLEGPQDQELEVRCYPAYFNSLAKAPYIDADDSASDPRTCELEASYLAPLGITSMLDSPIWLRGRMVGILCCEHTGPPRHWATDEKNFAASLADMVSLAMKADERRQAEAALRESEEKYRLIFSAESDAILLFDAETFNIVEVNEAAAHLYGCGREEFAGRSVDEIFAEPEVSRSHIKKASCRRVTRIPLAHHRKRDGTVFPVEISHGNFTLKGRKVCVGIVRDISERQQAMRMKDEMLSAVSHEMRTPLTAMLGFAEYLRGNEVDRAQLEEYLGIVVREGERLKDLTDNFLDLQRLRAGFGTANFKWTPVQPLLESVAHLLGNSSEHHTVVLDYPKDLPPLWGDERQLFRALQNLLSNAIKYSPDGGHVDIGARHDGDFLTFWVRDEGVGMGRKEQEQIFESFFHLNRQAKPGGGGTGAGLGLGLALVKAVTLAHRGQVWVESIPGRGSCFYMRLPVFFDEALS